MCEEMFIRKCKRLLEAYKNGGLGQTVMPEDSSPKFSAKQKEERLAYFTLPMALNYQRNSYSLWKSALETFNDEAMKKVFDVALAAKAPEQDLREALLKYKLALQPNKHIKTWQTICQTIYENWGSFEKFFSEMNGDFLLLKQTVEKDFKKGFPYLSGPKIFNYWSFIISTYGKQKLKNREYIEIAPDTHITKCSVKLGLISEEEAKILSKQKISDLWREALAGSDITPIDMHPPLWFWSRNGFVWEE